ncbi:hypothetical protein CSW46_01005, partial [Thermus scotoductus]
MRLETSGGTCETRGRRCPCGRWSSTCPSCGRRGSSGFSPLRSPRSTGGWTCLRWSPPWWLR